MKTLFLASLVVLAGCSAIPERSLHNVSERVKGSVGEELRPILSTKDASEIEAMVQNLLQTNLTLSTAVKIALLNNRGLHSTFENLGVSHAALIQAGLPQNIELAGSYRFPSEKAPYDNIEYGASANILNLFLLPLRKKVAARNLEAVELRVADEVLSLVSDVRSAFVTLQARQAFIERLRAVTELNEAAAELGAKQHEAGNITDLELANHQAVYAQSRAALAQAETQLRSDREALNRLLGLWGAMTRWQVADPLPEIPKEEMALQDLEKIAVANRLDIALAKKTVENTAYSLGIRESTRFFPATIHLGASTEKEPDGGRVTGPEIELELPLFDRGQGEIARLSAQRRKAERDLEALAVNARSEVRERRDLLIALHDLTQFYGNVLLPKQRQIVRETLLQYNAMQVGVFDLINAKERELQGERTFIETWRNYWIARFELERALSGTGRPSSRTLTSPNETEDFSNNDRH